MYTETTPNPLAIKIVLGVPPVSEGFHLFSSLSECATQPAVLSDLFSLPGLDSVLLTPEFITLTKTPEVPWSLLESIVLSVLSHHLDLFPLTINPRCDSSPSSQETHPWHGWTPPTAEAAEWLRDVETVIDERIRPGIEADGGMLTVLAFDQGILYIQLHGACSSCPHSQETLSGGIEQTLTYYFPEIQSVNLVP
jgi:Fe-S cluster biogenesis protein NfuA